MTLVKRTVKGSALTWAEADGNLDHFTTALALKADLEAELISGGVTTVSGTTITVGAAEWRVPPGTYAKVTSTVFSGITYSAAGNQRYVAFYGNTSNAVIKVEGTQAPTAVLPTQPANTALISYALVGDASIGDPTQDMTGYQLKSDKDESNGYVGLTLLKINFKNALNTFTSFFTNSNTAARTYIFQDRNGTIADDTDLALKEATANKDASGGYAGLTLFKLNLRNAANTITSFLTTAATGVRTWTFPDKDGTVAMTSDIKFEIGIACSDETTALTTGTAKVTFRIPLAITITNIYASVTTAPTGSTLVVDINEGGVSILSTKLSIDASETTSTTAATPYVLSDSVLAADSEITIDIDQIGSTIAGKGLKVTIIGTRN